MWSVYLYENTSTAVIFTFLAAQKQPFSLIAYKSQFFRESNYVWYLDDVLFDTYGVLIQHSTPCVWYFLELRLEAQKGAGEGLD